MNDIHARQRGGLGADIERVLALPFELWQEAGRYVVEIPMPGVRAQDVAVAVDGRTLEVRVTVERELSHGEPAGIVEEHHAGAATRRLVFPEGLDGVAARASLAGGKLQLVLPVGSSRGPRAVTVATIR